MKKEIKFIDLFCGMGGFRTGVENSLKKRGIQFKCVLSSDIKKHAIKVYEDNFNEKVVGDIKNIEIEDIEDFDLLIGGFPCQPFSIAGNRKGFFDTRGTLFFEIERILKYKKPKYFILENVEGLLTNKSKNENNVINTFEVIISSLQELNYNVSFNVLNAIDYGVPQLRKRVFIIGEYKSSNFNFDKMKITKSKELKYFLEKNIDSQDNEFTKNIMSVYDKKDLYGKHIKDKRSGGNNIHSWDLNLNGETTIEEKELLNILINKRRLKEFKNSDFFKFADGNPLSFEQIYSFYKKNNLQDIINNLVTKGYLKEKISKNKTFYDLAYLNGMSFFINKILDPNGYSLTLTATDTSRFGVIDAKTNKLRKLTKIELCRLFGFEDNYRVEVSTNQMYDLFGNTVVVPIVEEICNHLIEI